MKQLFTKAVLSLSLFAGALSSATAQIIPSDIGSGYFNGHIFPEHFSDVARTVPLSRNVQTLGPWYGKLGSNTFTVTFGQPSLLRSEGSKNVIGKGAAIGTPNSSLLGLSDIQTINGSLFPGMYIALPAGFQNTPQELVPLWSNSGSTLPNGCSVTWSFDNNLDILDHFMTGDIDANEEIYIQFLDAADNVLSVSDNVNILHITEDNDNPSNHSPLVITAAEEIFINGRLNPTTGRSVANEVYAMVMKTGNVRKIIATQKGLIAASTTQGYSLLLSKGAPDRGDAPSSYGDASILSLEPKLKLGTIGGDSEKDPQYHGTAEGDDVYNPGSSFTTYMTWWWNRTWDDEDGVAAIVPIANSGTGGEIIPAYSVTASITNNNGADAYAVAWLDWNGNGIFDAGETSSLAIIPDGSNNVSHTFTWNNVELTGVNGRSGTFLRIRLSSTPMTATDATGFISNGIGEVEDYFVPFVQPLPVKLTGFNATKAGKTTLLEWATASEQNNKGFEIERSKDAQNWKNIGFVPTKAIYGHSSTSIDYEYNDVENIDNKLFYRLKQIDNDGSFTYSEIKSINSGSIDEAIAIFPNPAHDQLSIKGLHTGDHVRVWNLLGQEIYAEKISGSVSGIFTLNVSQFAEGVYHVVVEQGNTYFSQKFLKQ